MAAVDATENNSRLCTLLHRHVRKWEACFTGNCDEFTILHNFRNTIKLSTDDSYDVINQRFKHYMDMLLTLYNRMYKNNLMDNTENKIAFHKIFEAVHYAKQVLLSLVRIKMTMTSNAILSVEENSLNKFEMMEYDDMKPVQKVLMYLLDKLSELGFRKYKGNCYKCIYTTDGYCTFAWEMVESIETVIYQLTSKNENMPMFLLVTKSGGSMIKTLTEYLDKCHDNHFPTLKKNRHIFGFRNGVYVAKTWNNSTNWWSDKFYPYEDTENMPIEITASKFFDIDFIDYSTVEEIPTPSLDKIFVHQKLSQDVIKWNYVYLGRLLYDVGDLDNWQTIMFLLGQGGTGKSTINNVAKYFYEEQDVAVVSNNIQKKFGLADVYDKLLYIAPEIKNDWCLEQSEFQEMTSGGPININIKFKESKVVKWKTPGMLGGNEPPNFIDNSGSIKRRMLITRFDNMVHRGDTLLSTRLQCEIGAIIKKCNLLYQYAVYNVGDSNIWDHLPSYFVHNQESMCESTNSLYHFLSSGMFHYGDNLYCPVKLFLTQYNTHCSDNNICRNRFVKDFYTAPFNHFNIKISEHNTLSYPQNNTYEKVVTDKFLRGVDFRCNSDCNHM